jgi:hypothetical protein
LISRIRSLGDSMLSVLLPGETASACIPPQPYYVCKKVHNACYTVVTGPYDSEYYCVNDCANKITCTWDGYCCT